MGECLFYLGMLIMIVFVLQVMAFSTCWNVSCWGVCVPCRPNKVDYAGVFQSIVDGMKLRRKEHLWLFLFKCVYCWFCENSFFGLLYLDFLILWLCFIWIVIFVTAFSVHPVVLWGLGRSGAYSLLGGLLLVRVFLTRLFFLYSYFLQKQTAKKDWAGKKIK